MSETVIAYLIFCATLSLIMSALALAATIFTHSAVKQKELHISQIHTAVSNVFVKTEVINQNLGKVMAGLGEVLDAYSDLIEKTMINTGNGKIRATMMNIDELMGLIEGKDKNVSQADLDELKKMFSSDIDNDDDDDDEDEDDLKFKQQ